MTPEEMLEAMKMMGDTRLNKFVALRAGWKGILEGSDRGVQLGYPPFKISNLQRLPRWTTDLGTIALTMEPMYTDFHSISITRTAPLGTVEVYCQCSIEGHLRVDERNECRARCAAFVLWKEFWCGKGRGLTESICSIPEEEK